MGERECPSFCDNVEAALKHSPPLPPCPPQIPPLSPDNSTLFYFVLFLRHPEMSALRGRSNSISSQEETETEKVLSLLISTGQVSNQTVAVLRQQVKRMGLEDSDEEANSEENSCSEAELRRNLSIAHKLTHHFNMDELIWNHISARLPFSNKYLITPGKMLFHRIKPSDLVETSLNATADIIHNAVYSARPDVNSVVHLHTPGALAVSCLKDGFQPLDQGSALFVDRVATHKWQGVSLDSGEGPMIAKSVLETPEACILVMQNHGFCALGSSVKEAWVMAFYFEKACANQIATFSAASITADVGFPCVEILRETRRLDFANPDYTPGIEWEALSAEMDLVYPDK